MMPKRKFNTEGKRGKSKRIDEDEGEERGSSPEQIGAEDGQTEGSGQDGIDDVTLDQQVKDDQCP